MAAFLLAGLSPETSAEAPEEVAALPGTLRASAARIAPEEAPTLDGVPDEPVWEKAVPLENFTQVHPEQGAAPTERTVVRILYDEANLYFGIRCFDSEPDKVIARYTLRDSRQSGDDVFMLLLDPLRNYRSGYYFTLNPLGAMRDGLLHRARSAYYDSSWDGIWDARCRRDDAGWTIEIVLPFKTLSFDPASSAWGVNFRRTIPRKNESIRWNHPVRGDTIYNMRDFGELEGLADLKPVRGLELRPFLAFAYSRRSEEDHFDEQAGLDLAYRFNPRVTAQLSYKMDFAETEVDSRQINLSRFPLFFPEKRDFFLENNSIFTFGGVFRSPVAFHSRRIGLTESGDPLDILAAAKLSGSFDGGRFGLIDAQMDKQAGLGSKNLSVGRVLFDVGEESTWGILATNGEPHATGNNTLGGIDYSYRNSEFTSAALDFQANFYLMGIEADDVSGNPSAFGSSLSARNDEWYVYAGAEQVDDEFDPALGYVRQDDIHEYDLFVRRRYRPENLNLPLFPVDSVDVEFEGNAVIRLGGSLDSWQWEPGIELESKSGDEIEFIHFLHRENLLSPHVMEYGEQAGESVTLPAADYRWNRSALILSSSDHRPLSATVVLSGGDYYDGEMDYLNLSLSWKTTDALLLGCWSRRSRFRFEQGAFDTTLAGANLTLGFNPRLSYLLDAQFDSYSDSVGFNHRFRWIRKPGDELFLVVNQEAEVENGWSPSATEAKVKAGWTYRF